MKVGFTTRLAVLAALLAGLALTAGCTGKGVDYLSVERLNRGMVFTMDGVGGYNWGPRWLRSGLDEAGVEYAVDIFSWGHGPAGMFITDLWDEAGNKKQARELADMIVRYQKFYPDRPVYIIGHSGGGGMVVFTLEQLPEDVQVAGVFLLATALDPSRNLAPALRHVRGGCYVTYSPADLPLMGLGTSVFSTMDGKHTPGAGLVGFKLPAHLAPEEAAQYEKVRQAKWEGSMMKEGYIGDHMSWTSTRFARDYIAPILLGREPGPVFQPLVASGRAGASATQAAAERGGRQ